MGGDTTTPCVLCAGEPQHPLHHCPSATWFNKSATDLRHPESGTGSHCALKTRYIRYTVANQPLKALQISYTSVTTVTLLSISNLDSTARCPRFKRVPVPSTVKQN